MSILLQTKWLAMILLILVWPTKSYQTVIKPYNFQDNYNISKDISNNNFTIQSNNNFNKKLKTKNYNPTTYDETIELNESEKLRSKNFLTSDYVYDNYNKTNKESTVNISSKQNGTIPETESKDSTYMGDEPIKNPTQVVGGVSDDNIPLSINNNKETTGLSNDKSPNQTNQVETLYDNGTNYYGNLFGKSSRNLKNNPQHFAPKTFEIKTSNLNQNEAEIRMEQRDIDDALEYGFKYVQNLVEEKEPLFYKLGHVLKPSDPAYQVANFGRPKNEKARSISKIGQALLEASKKLSQTYSQNASLFRAISVQTLIESRVELDQCPFRGLPRCPPASRRFRTADGVCNNVEHPWRGSAMLPMLRFLPPVYDDGIQSIRRSVLGPELPSPRDVSSRIHRDINVEIDSVTMMFTQWGQFLDHDIVSAVKHLSFNGSTPRCCDADGRGFLPQEFLHPECLPIKVSRSDPFLSKFGVRCMEFTRSSPSASIDCHLGWREQINQVTPFIDASMIFGNDVDTMDSLRTFRNGKIVYGRPRDQGPLNPPDHADSELCRAGVISEECLQSGDTRIGEQPGLIAMHTVFVRYHNKIATVLSKLNPHWSDERTFQETRRIVYSAIQHITYREYLPIVLGPQVMDLFELRLLTKGYYDQYDPKINPEVANSFGAAAFRFGHSMVQNSFVRTDPHHIPLNNNVSMHEEDQNEENIWSFGAVDRLMLGFSNQPSQRRDEFIARELTNHLFQFSNHFGMDLAAINIQRGRDHGIPPYTYWRLPCGLSPIKRWEDLEKVMNKDVVNRLSSLYLHVDDIDLFTAGLAEKPLKGGVVGPTFACIIAQQFVNLRRGDRFWYENGGFSSSFTPPQLQQIRRISLAQILCQTMDEIETIQPFVFLSPDSFKNSRLVCNGPDIRNFDLSQWTEQFPNFETNHISGKDFIRTKRSPKRKPNLTTTTKPKLQTNKPKIQTNKLKIDITNVTVKEQPPQTKNYQQSKPTQYYQLQDTNQNDVTYLLGLVPEKITPKPQVAPVEVNIKIQYFAPTTTTTTQKTILIKKKPTTSYFVSTNRPTYYEQINFSTKRPTSKKPNIVTYRPTKVPHIVTPDYNYPSTPNYNRPYRPTTTYYDDPNDYYDYRPTNKPTNYYDIQDENDDDSVVISSSFTNNRNPKPNYNSVYNTNKRPPTNTYNDFYNSYNKRPVTNSYDTYIPIDDDNVFYNTNNKRPTSGHNPYNRDRIDNTDDIQDNFFNNNLTKRPIFGQTNFTLPNNRFQSTTPRLGIINTYVNDKLDFESRFMDDDSRVNIDKGNFVKIGTVKGEIEIKERNGKSYNIKDKKEVFQKDESRNKYKEKEFRTFRTDVEPNNVSNQRNSFDGTDYYGDEHSEDVNIDMPNFINKKGSFSEEIPKPMVEFSSNGESGYVKDRLGRKHRPQRKHRT